MPTVEERKYTDPESMRSGIHSFILDSLTKAITPLGTPAQNIRKQLEAKPVEELINQIADEIINDQNRVDKEVPLDDELAQQNQAQEIIRSFGASPDRSTTTKKTKSTDTIETESEKKETEPEDMEIDGPTEEPEEQTETQDAPNQEKTPSEKEEEAKPDDSLTPEIPPETDEEDDKADTHPDTDENQDGEQNDRESKPDNSTQQLQKNTQQQAQMQQTVEMMSKQQLANQLKQLQQQKRELQKQQLDEHDTEKAFGIDQAALFVPAITVFAYFVDLIDITEFVAPFIDMIVAIIALYWRVTRSAKLKLFYLKRLPVFILARILGMIPFVSYLFPEGLVEFKNMFDRINKFRKAKKMVVSLEKRIKKIDQQITMIQKQLSNKTMFSRFRKK